MPVAYGGGITSVEEIRRVLSAGIEKVVLNTAALRDPQLVRNSVREFGSQAVVVSIDVKRKLFGRYEVYDDGGQSRAAMSRWLMRDRWKILVPEKSCSRLSTAMAR